MMVVKIKKAKGTEKCVVKKSEIWKLQKLFRSTQLENNINYIEKIKFT